MQLSSISMLSSHTVTFRLARARSSVECGRPPTGGPVPGRPNSRKNSQPGQDLIRPGTLERCGRGQSLSGVRSGSRPARAHSPMRERTQHLHAAHHPGRNSSRSPTKTKMPSGMHCRMVVYILTWPFIYHILPMARQASFIKPLLAEQQRHLSCVGAGRN